MKKINTSIKFLERGILTALFGVLFISSINAQCVAVNVPYIEDFETVTIPNFPTCMSRQTITGNQWVTKDFTAYPNYGLTSKAAKYGYHTSQAANSWFYTKGINLIAGTSYRISFQYARSSASGSEKLKVAYGTDSVNTAMTTVLFDNPSITMKGSAFVIKDFVAPSTGVFYFGFQSYSTANQYDLYIDNIKIDLSPSCLEPANPIVNVASYTTANAIWNKSATAPANGYEYYYSTSATAPTSATTPKGATASANDTTALLTGLTSTTNYNFWVRAVCSGSDKSEWSSVAKFYTGICAPNSYVNNYYVNSVETVGGIIDISNLNTGKTGGGFEDYYATDSLMMYKGDTINFKYTVKSPIGAGLAIFVDWNNNWAFEPSEKIYTTTGDIQGVGASAIYKDSIKLFVPANVGEGTYRLRIIIDDMAVQPKPCEIANQNDGEAEDYRIVVKQPCTIPVVNLGGDTTICAGQTLTLDAESTGYNYVWSTGETSQTIAAITTGNYSVTVSSFSCVASDTITVTVTPNPVVSIQASKLIVCPNEDVVLTASGADTYIWNDNAIDTVRTVKPAATTIYKVTGNTGTCTANAEISIVVKTSGCDTGVEDLESTAVLAYPNPTSQLLTVQGENLAATFNTYSIVDLVGKEVSSGTVSSNSIEIETTKLMNGVYFINFNGNQFIKSIKIEVKH